MKVVFAALAVVLAFGASPVLAANARQPYSNINRRNDKGNDTGDSRVDMLNQQQLDAARAPAGTMPAPMGSPGMGAPMMPMKPGMTR